MLKEGRIYMTISIDKEIREIVQKIAEDEKISFSAVARRAITKYAQNCSTEK